MYKVDEMNGFPWCTSALSTMEVQFDILLHNADLFSWVFSLFDRGCGIMPKKPSVSLIDDVLLDSFSSNIKWEWACLVGNQIKKRWSMTEIKYSSSGQLRMWTKEVLFVIFQKCQKWMFRWNTLMDPILPSDIEKRMRKQLPFHTRAESYKSLVCTSQSTLAKMWNLLFWSNSQYGLPKPD